MGEGMKSDFQGGSGRVLNPVKILKVFGGGKKKTKKRVKILEKRYIFLCQRTLSFQM